MKRLTFCSEVTACAVCLLMLTSCHELDSGIDSSTSDSDRITLRQDCDGCDCHCFVELKNDNAASLELCGTCDGPTTGCTGINTCGFGTFSGDGHTISLTSTLNPRYDFCEEINTGFWIQNTSSTDTANVILAVQHNLGCRKPLRFSFCQRNANI
ncbi:MAG TPA: hypothetical protein VI603_07285 [Saprospiraceae bacterium]|nr:hypothetical protein [Saprospiraceae bacterium]